MPCISWLSSGSPEPTPGSELTSDRQAIRCSQFLRSCMQGGLALMATLRFHFALSATLRFQRAKDSGLALLKTDPLRSALWPIYDSSRGQVLVPITILVGCCPTKPIHASRMKFPPTVPTYPYPRIEGQVKHSCG